MIQSSITASSNPQDWRGRTRAHKERIAALLIERAEQGMGVQGSDLYDHPELFGHSPRNRISELGKDGWDIGRKLGEHRCFFYWLRRDGNGRTYPTRRFDDPEPAPESAFMRRRREEQEQSAPLFAGVR